MKVITPGINPKEAIEQEHVCNQCGCKFSFNNSDIRSDVRDGDYVICPNRLCGAFISAKAKHRLFGQ